MPYFLTASTGTPSVDTAEAPGPAFYVTSDTSTEGTVFPAHRHDGDELMWARRGRYDVVVDGRRLAVSADQLVWMPAHTVHEAELHRDGELICLFAEPVLRPDGEPWARPRVLEASALTTALLEHLVDEERPRSERQGCRELLYCLLRTAPESSGTLAIPSDPRGRHVARALLADPALGRGLADWASEVSTSPRTLARIFVAETGLSFGDWRKSVRMNVAVALLADGQPVREVATSVGYATTSSFIETFRHHFGTTPAAFRRAR